MLQTNTQVVNYCLSFSEGQGGGGGGLIGQLAQDCVNRLKVAKSMLM